MQASEFEEEAFFGAVARTGARYVLIGRRALIVLGLPVMTGDYDFWLHIDDIEKLNTAAAAFELLPNRSPAEARANGRYAFEGDERVDVLIARSVSTVDGQRVLFDEVWSRRQQQRLSDAVSIDLPALDDLIATKKFVNRPRDLEDIRLLEVLRRGGS